MAVNVKQKVYFLFFYLLLGQCREWHSTLYIRCIFVFIFLFLLLGQSREWHSTLFIGVSVYIFLFLGWEGLGPSLHEIPPPPGNGTRRFT
jgi:hypothetical protein